MNKEQQATKIANNFNANSQLTKDIEHQIAEESDSGRYFLQRVFKRGEISCDELNSMDKFMKLQGFKTFCFCDRKGFSGVYLSLSWGKSEESE